MTVHVRVTAVALVTILGLGAFIESLLLQSLLLQLIHGTVETARVCGLTVGIGVARARGGGDIVVGLLVVLLLVGVLSAIAVGITALVRGHARVMARAPTVAVAALIVGIEVIGGLAGTAVGIDHAIRAGLGVASVTVLVVSAGRVAILLLACMRLLAGDSSRKLHYKRRVDSIFPTSVVACSTTVIAHLRRRIICWSLIRNCNPYAEGLRRTNLCERTRPGAYWCMCRRWLLRKSE